MLRPPRCWPSSTATWRSPVPPATEREATADGWGNLFAAVPRDAADEEFRKLLVRPGLTIERIVSTGQVSPDWYDQEHDEWVLLVTGGAHLLLEGEGEMVLGPGDHLLIAAHVRHRVTWTDPARPTVWLAIHFVPDGADG